jgi:aminoglycoside phosphotransferase
MLMQAQLNCDPAFPGLSDALDPALAARAFAEALSLSGRPVTNLDCAVERVRIKRGVKVVIGYRLTGVDGQGQRIDQHAMVSLWPDGDPARLKDMGGEHVQPLFGPPTLLLERIGGKAWFFPNDRKVHNIAALMNGPTGLAGGAAEVIHYVPEQGCTVRYTHQGRSLFGKTRADDRCTVSALVDQAAQNNGRLPVRLVCVIEHDRKHRILWQEEVPGRELTAADVLAEPETWAPRIAIAIAGFHSIKAPSALKSLTSQTIAHTLDQRAARTTQIMPELAAQISGIANALAMSCPGPGELLVSHCDLHPGNLLWDGTSFALIDLDTTAFAPPARDYGSLIAALIHKAIEARVSDDVIGNMVRVFNSAVPDVPHIAWFTAASLIGERLYRCGTRLKSPSIEVRSRLITLAQMILEDQDG